MVVDDMPENMIVVGCGGSSSSRFSDAFPKRSINPPHALLFNLSF